MQQLTDPQQPALEKLEAIPGIDRRVAEVLLAEIGAAMTPFPSAGHLACWAGICAGNNESSGPEKERETTQGSRWLRPAWVQAAGAASHKKDSYFQAHARNRMRRRGRKRGFVALAHSLPRVIYHMLKEGTDYHDLGHDFLDRIRSEHPVKFHRKRLRQLGLAVLVTPLAA
jgi:transposase